MGEIGQVNRRLMRREKIKIKKNTGIGINTSIDYYKYTYIISYTIMFLCISYRYRQSVFWYMDTPCRTISSVCIIFNKEINIKLILSIL